MARSMLSAAATRIVVALLAVCVALPAGAQYQSYGKNKVQYRDFNWQVYHSTHFDVHYYEAEANLLEKVVSFAESAYDELSRRFDTQLQDPIPLIFYKTHSEFEQNNIILNFIPESTGAFATTVRNRMVLPVDMSDPELMDLLLHELTHIFQYHILFQGSFGKGATLRPPQWFMEGMASYFADDESAHDKMVLRDAVVNDRIPPVGSNVGGYFAYRYGHALFDFIEERWGHEGVLDFIYEIRNTIGSRAGRAVQRAFRMDAEDFDHEFRRWLRQQYLERLVETGEPSDFGRPFRTGLPEQTWEISAVASPSGDLVAAFSAQKGDLDLVLFDSRRRRQIRNLTKGYNNEYEYLAVQGATVTRRLGRDLAFSPDGNQLAFFARRNDGRSLVFADVLNGGIRRTVSLPGVDQELAPAWSPDGKSIAFAGNQEGVFDIFLFDIASESLTKITDDEIYDGAPTFSPDGKSLVFTSVAGEHAKLFRIDLDNPSQRYQLTYGESDDRDATYSPDGERIYYTSDRGGFDNIYSLELATGKILQYTNVVTGCFTPTVLTDAEGNESVVYNGYWKGGFKLYSRDVDEPVAEVETVQVADTPAEPAMVPRFEPGIEVAIDEANNEKYRSRKFFLEDAGTFFGVDDNQTLLAQVFMNFSDMLGDRRIIAIINSYDALSGFNLTYANFANRLQWNVNLYDDRDFYFIESVNDQGFLQESRGEVRVTGASYGLSYPFGLSTRWEGAVGYQRLEVDRPLFDFNVLPGFGLSRDFNGFEELSLDYPYIQTYLVGDSANYADWGPISGRLWRVGGYWSPDIDNTTEDSTLDSKITLDVRQYISVSRRTNLMLRAFGGVANGGSPRLFYLGGYDTIRGFDFRDVIGDRAAFINLEYRFPLIDELRTPVARFQGIRGRIFLDVAGVWFDEEDFDFYNSDESRLEDGIAVYGWGFTARLFGLDWHWDFGQRWDGKDEIGGFETSFYIGRRY